MFVLTGAVLGNRDEQVWCSKTATNVYCVHFVCCKLHVDVYIPCGFAHFTPLKRPLSTYPFYRQSTNRDSNLPSSDPRDGRPNSLTQGAWFKNQVLGSSQCSGGIRNGKWGGRKVQSVTWTKGKTGKMFWQILASPQRREAGKLPREAMLAQVLKRSRSSRSRQGLGNDFFFS